MYGDIIIVKKEPKKISVGIIIAGVLVIAGVFAIDAVNYKENPYRKISGKYHSEECKPLVLSDGNYS